MKPIIDISFWQPPLKIDYDKLAEQVSGVILRAAYGTSKDIHFEQHYAEFSARGVPLGAYPYLLGSQAISKQANALNEFTAGKDLKLGRWMDVEDTRPGTRLYRNNVLDYAALMPDMGIYTSRSRWHEIMGGAYLTDRKLWVAHYTTALYPLLPVGWDSWWLWQYTSSGRLDGYAGNLDTNRFYGDDADFAAWIGGEVQEPEEPPVEPEEPPVEIPVTLPYEATVTANVLIVRDAPAGADTGARLKSGKVITVHEESGNWARINAWVSRDWIERVTNIPPVVPPSGNLAVEALSQRDTRWASHKLGYSSYTIGGYGCLITAISMILNWYGKSTDPAQLNDALVRVGGFTGANLYWNAIAQVQPDVYLAKSIDCYYIPAPLHEIDALLADDVPVLVHVLLNGLQHWVLIVGKAGDDYIMNDPWTGEQGSFTARYGDPARWIFRIRAYRRAL